MVESPHETLPLRPRIALICHEDEPLNRDGLARWLNSFGDLVGIVELHEGRDRKWQRVRREVKRVGPLRFLDVLAFRAYSKIFLSSADAAWERRQLCRLRLRFPASLDHVPVLPTDSPNGEDVESFLQFCEPTLVIARCKTLLKERIFSIPTRGTYVMHPGICPQYRNAHGCFWAMAEDDLHNVGMTLLKIDRGVDTGPVYGFYRCPFNPVMESHHVIQDKVVLENLKPLAAKFQEIATGAAQPIATAGHDSRTWGQPWLSAYLNYRHREQQRASVGAGACRPGLLSTTPS
ncbi:MAG: formyl transferase [Planctomycetaceae bacterium]|nr:formyl transferase [Planctomycetaceae bacterium]